MKKDLSLRLLQEWVVISLLLSLCRHNDDQVPTAFKTCFVLTCKSQKFCRNRLNASFDMLRDTNMWPTPNKTRNKHYLVIGFNRKVHTFSFHLTPKSRLYRNIWRDEILISKPFNFFTEVQLWENDCWSLYFTLTSIPKNPENIWFEAHSQISTKIYMLQV